MNKYWYLIIPVLVVINSVIWYKAGIKKGMNVGARYMAESIREALNSDHETWLEKQKAKSGSK